VADNHGSALVDYVLFRPSRGDRPEEHRIRLFAVSGISMLATTRAVASVLLAMASLSQAAEQNVILDNLLERGVSIGSTRLRLPTATLADGLSARQQKQSLAQISDDNHPLDALVHKAVVAPFVLRIQDEPNAGQGRPRRVDLWFVAHGDFDHLSDEDFLKRQVDTEMKSQQGGSLTEGAILTEDQLRARKIEIVPDERFLTVNLELFNRVNVRGTMRARLSRGPESVTVAATLEPRFAQDHEFPNAWRSLQLNDAGRVVVGPARPYGGAAWYCKATRLKQPQGAVLVEYHIAFDEPEGWFNGANLLRSKLPLLVQDGVRKFRRRFAEQTGPPQQTATD
jgi:hypothetical protein